jgi:hypothetical protein
MFDDQTCSHFTGNSEQDRGHAMNYMVEVFLDENNSVRRTIIHHIQSGQEDTWNNWDEDRLLSFFNQRPELRLTQFLPATENDRQDKIVDVDTAVISMETVAALLPSSETTVSPKTENNRDKFSPGVLHLNQMEIIPEHPGVPCRTFNHHQAFDVRLYLYLADVDLSERGALSYSVSLVAMRVGAMRQHQYIKRQGRIAPKNHLDIRVKWPTLPPGIYRISASVTITSKDNNSLRPEEFTAFLEGGLYNIY